MTLESSRRNLTLAAVLGDWILKHETTHAWSDWRSTLALFVVWIAKYGT
jgi:hypothetical protein